ncbi:hypothetical protein AVEN_73955-1 [Araneus ventricosus]|uniref:Uncharacterized protein n=1 Tax=Araneus ventricosus TaxID=182803 RepID=A0A4Y2PLP7_ARAVE|nr:hypothetical protein AVEN_189838-1 [Araneus ventricosus]GBN51241.1 hypothetical protein AVEN_73955-1 [Araneus ventricosus]
MAGLLYPILALRIRPFNFQPIHLGGSFMVAPNRRSLRYAPPPAFKTGSPPQTDSQSHSPSPMCGFRVRERALLPFFRIAFQFHDRMRQMENERHWISKLFDHNSPILIGYSHWRRVLVRGAPNEVERSHHECPA